jgi:hypothetical protein
MKKVIKKLLTPIVREIIREEEAIRKKELNDKLPQLIQEELIRCLKMSQ